MVRDRPCKWDRPWYSGRDAAAKGEIEKTKEKKRVWVNQKHKGNKEILIDCTVVDAMRFQSNEGLYFQRKSKQETRSRK